MSRLKSAVSEWECPQCGKQITMHVAGTREVGHRCPATLKWKQFRRTWGHKYA